MQAPPDTTSLEFYTRFVPVSTLIICLTCFYFCIDAEAVKKTRNAVAGGCQKEFLRGQLSPAHKWSVFKNLLTSSQDLATASCLRPNIIAKEFGRLFGKSRKKTYFGISMTSLALILWPKNFINSCLIPLFLAISA